MDNKTRRSKVVSFEKVLEAFEFVSFGRPVEFEAFLCRATGEIYYHSEIGENPEPLPEDIGDTRKYVAIPHKNELDLGERLATRFAGEFMADDLGRVRGIFGRRGAYARFKNLLETRGMLERWYQYEADAQRQALKEWCEVEGIETDTAT